ncbi:hypothetical protein ECDEC10F_2446 [Escherichia coli DEC10F]|nr:hypothetical protein ECDEC10F_2446 [Escherichia coli DEC10F]KDT04767.1 hypothetical protein AB54_1025 [Escherichia coli 2-011-08_S1_C3]
MRQLFISKIENVMRSFSKCVFLDGCNIFSLILCVRIDEKSLFCDAVKNYCPITA